MGSWRMDCWGWEWQKAAEWETLGTGRDLFIPPREVGLPPWSAELLLADCHLMLMVLWWLTQWLSELRVPPYPPPPTPPHPSSCLPHPQPLPYPFPSSSPKFLLVLSRELCGGYWHARWMAVMWVATVLWHEGSDGLKEKDQFSKEREAKGKQKKERQRRKQLARGKGGRLLMTKGWVSELFLFAC